MTRLKQPELEPTRPFLKEAFSYGRFSDKKSNPVSIEDQERICDELAARHGAYIPPQNRFRDEAIQGSVSREDRPGWNALCKLIEAGSVHYLFADEHTRLFRSSRESVDIKEQIIKHNIAVICRDVCTTGDEWELLWEIKAALGVEELRKISGRIKRAQKGLVASGKSTGPASYGYTRKPVYNAKGDREYSLYAIDPVTSVIVQRIFAERKAGVSCDKIARGLNLDGIPTPSGGDCWDGAIVVPLLSRPIYKGIQKFGPNVSSQPHLALVSDEDWQLAQSKAKRFSFSGRGGGKFWSTGLVRCGFCGTVMTTSSRRAKQLFIFCSRCRSRKMAGAQEYSMPNCTVPILEAALTLGMQLILTPERIAGYRESIIKARDRTIDDEIRILTEKVALIDRGLKRLAGSIATIGDELAVKPFEEQACALRDDRSALLLSLTRIKQTASNVTKDHLDKQLKVDPRTLVPRLFLGQIAPWELRSLLCRLFLQIVFERRSKTEVVFKVTMSPGALFSTLSDTPTVDMPHQSYSIRVMRGGYRDSKVELEGQIETPILPERFDARSPKVKSERQEVIKSWRLTQGAGVPSSRVTLNEQVE
jgi:site-specific DNA recombinase